MKYKELLKEMPYLHLGSMKLSKQTSYSLEALHREFDFLYQFDHNIGNIKVYKRKTTNMVVGIDPRVDSDGRCVCVFSLLFKDDLSFSYDLKKAGIHDEILQVDRVELHKRYELAGFTSSVYQWLINHGYSIVSDSTQFEPAKGLWKKLARKNNKIIVFDIDYGPFKDSDGNIIIYDGDNIPDDDIWSIGSNFDGYNRLLCLTS